MEVVELSRTYKEQVVARRGILEEVLVCGQGRGTKGDIHAGGPTRRGSTGTKIDGRG